MKHIYRVSLSSQGFFDEYVGACLLWMKINVRPIVPVEDMALVQVPVQIGCRQGNTQCFTQSSVAQLVCRVENCCPTTSYFSTLVRYYST